MSLGVVLGPEGFTPLQHWGKAKTVSHQWLRVGTWGVAPGAPRAKVKKYHREGGRDHTIQRKGGNL